MKQDATALKVSASNGNAMQVITAENGKEQTAKVIPLNSEKKPTEKAPALATTPEEKKPLTIDEIKRKNEVLRRLTEKYDTLQGKLRKVENFAISHDQDTASVIVTDAMGEEFESNSPKTIGKLIEFWKAEFNSALQEVEKEIHLNA